jgi:peptidoglycan-associated lipoprotein
VSNKEGQSFTVTTNSRGEFSIPRGQMEEDKSYKLNMSRKRFLNAVGDITTKGLALNDYAQVKEERAYVKSYSLRLEMDPIEVPIVLPNVFFDLAKSELREESKIALDTVFSILQRNPTITIGLRSHTDYRDTDAKNDACLKHVHRVVWITLLKKVFHQCDLQLLVWERKSRLLSQQITRGMVQTNSKPGTI